MSNLGVKFFLGIAFVFCIISGKGQPLSPPKAFEDSYKGLVDDKMKAAKVKTKKTYFRTIGDSGPTILYTALEYNIKGYLISQKWYSLVSKREMYTAQYEYDNNDKLASCIEKITKNYDFYNGWSRKRTNEGYPVNDTPENPFGEMIPCDKDSNIVVKTIYKRDSVGNYRAKKYYSDGTFYREVEYPFWQFEPQFYDNLYISGHRDIDFICSDHYFKADTIYASADTLKININLKRNSLNFFNILKTKQNKVFVISEIDRVLDNMKLYFSYQNAGFSDATTRNRIQSITYLSYKKRPDKFLLVHKFTDIDTIRIPLHDRIELIEMHNNNMQYFIDTHGCINYTIFKDGYLHIETQYSLGFDRVSKLRDILYTKRNLPSERIQYEASFGLIESSSMLNYDYVEKIVETNEYEYFDKP